MSVLTVYVILRCTGIHTDGLCGTDPIGVFKKYIHVNTNGVIDPDYALAQLRKNQPQNFIKLMTNHRFWLTCMKNSDTGYFKRSHWKSNAVDKSTEIDDTSQFSTKYPLISTAYYPQSEPVRYAIQTGYKQPLGAEN
ncbi:hypothetical protein P879_03517 [Paragonimus westermani]|uniref:Uncharacterized protein n=1 Tax=Paragonimus westermani TaxID=34504 RepID=A0A8T0DM86_9TREM|nr:hypothetical protein P879_03517 [Paragonimus westermani]